MTQPEQEAREMLIKHIGINELSPTQMRVVGRAMVAFAVRPTAGIDREEPNVETAQAGIESAAESDGTDQAAGTEEGPQGSSQTIEARKLAERLTVDADGIVKAWDQRYAPEGVGAGIMRPVEVDTMREAAAFLRGLPTAAKTGERGAVIEECAKVSPAEAFEMGFAWRGGLTGQTLEDSRAVGRTLGCDIFDPISDAITAQIKAQGFNSFESADLGICAAKKIILAALEALSQPLPDAKGDTQ